MERRQLLTAPQPGDESALRDFLWQRIGAIRQPRTIKVAVDVQPGATVVDLCVAAPNEDDPAALWPALVANVNTTRLRIYFGQKTKRQMHIEFLTYLASLSFRLIGEVFACLPAAGVVTLDASSTSLVPGKVKRELRLRVERSDWARIDFGKLKELDPSAWVVSYRY